MTFDPEDIVFHKEAALPGHTNGMRFTALDRNGYVLDTRIYYSVGGGFVIEDGEDADSHRRGPVPYEFKSAEELLRIGKEQELAIHVILLANELAWRSVKDVREGIQDIWEVMQDYTRRGLETTGELPGGLQVRRRAPEAARRLQQVRSSDPLSGMDWLNVWAIAVNEKNAAGRKSCNRADEWRSGHHPSRRPLLLAAHGWNTRRHSTVLSRRRRNGRPLQRECLDLRRRGWLPR